MPSDKRYKYSIQGVALYPHFKITDEAFPRVLATRVIADDRAEYFGAFLNRTNARRMIGLINKNFRLRTCDIDVDGSFDVPCPQYYRKHCVAPCVASLCSPAEYDEMVSLARLFLTGKRQELAGQLHKRIAAAAEALEFEAAAYWRDILISIEAFWEDKRAASTLDDTVDTYDVRITDHVTDIFVITQRNRRQIGERVFTFDVDTEEDALRALTEVIEQFYRFHLPREIRAPLPLEERTRVANTLSERFGRAVSITGSHSTIRITATRAIKRSHGAADIRRMASVDDVELGKRLKSLLGLSAPPFAISAVDAAHISGTDLIGAAVVWDSSAQRTLTADYVVSDGSETQAIAEIVGIISESDASVMLIDGGRPQLNAAMAAMGDRPDVKLISAVKPPGKHSQISHFLTDDGRRIDFDFADPACRLLQRLRDQAHSYANRVHRDVREFPHYYVPAAIVPSLVEGERQRIIRHFGSPLKLAATNVEELSKILEPKDAKAVMKDIERYRNTPTTVKPFIVPIRYQDPDGAAEDLLPIERT
jgi:excinuclease ABC subunit C